MSELLRWVIELALSMNCTKCSTRVKKCRTHVKIAVDRSIYLVLV